MENNGQCSGMCATWERTLIFRLEGRGSTLSGRIIKESGSIAGVGAHPLVFKEKLRILRANSVPAVLHGIEASPVSISGLAPLRSRQSVACAGAVLSLFGGAKGAKGSDPVYLKKYMGDTSRDS